MKLIWSQMYLLGSWDLQTFRKYEVVNALCKITLERFINFKTSIFGLTKCELSH